jgi:chemotaxis signal transduction protein
VSAGEAVLVFQLGPRLLAARAAGVDRVGNPRQDGIPALVDESLLGRPRAPMRSLIVLSASGEEEGLCVDQVLGLRSVDAGDIRPLPPFAVGILATAAVAGLVMLDGTPTPLIDLPTLFREQRQAAARDARSSDA